MCMVCGCTGAKAQLVLSGGVDQFITAGCVCAAIVRAPQVSNCAPVLCVHVPTCRHVKMQIWELDVAVGEPAGPILLVLRLPHARAHGVL